jgi:hypothetical protein
MIQVGSGRDVLPHGVSSTSTGSARELLAVVDVEVAFPVVARFANGGHKLDQCGLLTTRIVIIEPLQSKNKLEVTN